jgi:hypothetical protein
MGAFQDSEFAFHRNEKNKCCKELYGIPFQGRQHLFPKFHARAEIEPFGFHAIRDLSTRMPDDAGYPITDIGALLRRKSGSTTAGISQTTGYA